MNQQTRRRPARAEELSLALMQRYSALTRAAFTRTRTGVSRTEAAVLGALSTRPYRVTDLAAAEGVSQPAITQLVNRLEERGFVERRGDPGDGRVVLVRLTDAGSETLERLRAEFRAVIQGELAELDDAEVATLASAVETLDRVIAHLT
jgi:DNA-binding MarR family transcriptional regulator